MHFFLIKIINSKNNNINRVSFNNCNCHSSCVNVNHIHIYVDIDNNMNINIEIDIHIYVDIEINYSNTITMMFKLIIISTGKMLKITIIIIPINFRESYREDHNQLILIIS